MATTAKSGTTDHSKSGHMTLRELRGYEGELYAENMSATQFSCRTPKGYRVEVDFELGPKGSDEAIALLPKECLEIPGFQRSIVKGIVAISTDPEMEDKIELQVQDAVKADLKRHEEILAMTEESSTKKDLVPKSCWRCGTQVFQSLREVGEGVAPLCPMHIDMKDKLIPTMTSQGEWTWKARAEV